MKPPLRRIALLGLGLMGGSLARALRAYRPDLRLAAWTPDGTEPEDALRGGVIDDAPADLGSTLADADLVVLAAPVSASIELLRACRDLAPAGAIITDLCSVKAPVCEAALDALPDRFVGGHPFCGSHQSGWAAARANLYDGQRIFIVQAGAEAATVIVEDLWRSIGARPERIDAVDHDALMARASHLPQIVSSALGATLARAAVSSGQLGTGGADVTRLSASDPGLWSDLLLHNRAEVGAALSAFGALLGIVHAALESGDREALAAVLAAARDWSGSPS